MTTVNTTQRFYQFARRVLPGFSLLLVVILAYLPVWHAGYIWDDDILVTANPCVVGPLGLREIWTTKAADICPLTITTFWAEHRIWGNNSVLYHSANVLMHGICAILLWRVLLRLRVPGAWLGAALWAVHPIQVESVAWITEMKNTQSGVFYLLAILSYLKWLDAGETVRRDHAGWNYALTLIYSALAMASKSSTVVLPLILCLITWWIEGRWNWRGLLKLSPIFLLSVAATSLSLWTQVFRPVDNPHLQPTRGWPERLMTAGDAVWFYLGKIVWPHPLIAIYPRWEVDPHQWIGYLPLTLALAGLCAAWLLRHSVTRVPYLVYAYFLLALLPTLGLVTMSYFRHSFVADHFAYLASMGPLSLAGAGIVSLQTRFFRGKAWPHLLIQAGVLLILASTSWSRAGVFASQESLWTDALSKNANCLNAHVCLSIVDVNRGRFDEAIDHCRKALAIDPTNIETNYNLGNALLQKGQVDEAVARYQKVLALDPLYYAAYINLGNVFLLRGDLEEAIAQYEAGLKLRPDNFEAHFDMGEARLRQGQVDTAIAQYHAALALNPMYAKAHDSLGNALSMKGRLEEAIEEYREELREDPAAAGTHFKLGNLFFHQGKIDEAVAEYRAVLKANPNNAVAHCNLGVALARRAQVNDAMAEFEEAIRLKPDYDEARNNLAKVQAAVRSNGGLR